MTDICFSSVWDFWSDEENGVPMLLIHKHSGEWTGKRMLEDERRNRTFTEHTGGGGVKQEGETSR